MEITFSNFLKDELTITEIQVAMENGEITSKELTMYYLNRIATYDQDGPKINSILEINPDALFIAEALDYERKQRALEVLYTVFLSFLKTVLKRMIQCIQAQEHLH